MGPLPVGNASQCTMRRARTCLSRHPARVEPAAGFLFSFRSPDVPLAVARASRRRPGAGAGLLFDVQSCASGRGSGPGPIRWRCCSGACTDATRTLSSPVGEERCVMWSRTLPRVHRGGAGGVSMVDARAHLGGGRRVGACWIWGSGKRRRGRGAMVGNARLGPRREQDGAAASLHVFGEAVRRGGVRRAAGGALRQGLAALEI